MSAKKDTEVSLEDLLEKANPGEEPSLRARWTWPYVEEMARRLKALAAWAANEERDGSEVVSLQRLRSILKGEADA